jgi:acyl carrier protein
VVFWVGIANLSSATNKREAINFMPKTCTEVMTEVTAIFREVLRDDAIRLEYQTTASDVKNWDSLAHVELVVAIEKHFMIRFNFAELQKFRNVGEWCDNIVAQLAKRA